MKSNKVRHRSELYSSTEEQVQAETGREEDYSALVKPNFQILSDEYPEFAKAWNKVRENQKDHTHINRNSRKAFSTVLDHTFNVALTRALLHKFFHLSLPSMPEGHLCPPVPNRFHYVQWLRTLLRQMYDSDDEYFSSTQVGRCRFKGLDIGCGASAIYPLLLSTPAFTQSLFTTKEEDPVYPTWKFLGTDIYYMSVQCAKQNVLANGLQDTIIIELVPPTMSQQLYTSGNVQVPREDGNNTNPQGPIFASMTAAQSAFPINNGNDTSSDGTTTNQYPRFDFCMTNPPFYSTIEEATLPRQGDLRKRTDMTLEEGFYPAGGEEAFVMDMIRDSFHYQYHFTWYTALLGKKRSLVTIEMKLKDMGFRRGQIRITSFIQGNNTRWGIAWTFYPASIRSPETRIIPHIQEFGVLLPKSCNPFSEVMDRIQYYMDQQQLSNLQQESDGTQKISYFSHRSVELGSRITQQSQSPCYRDQPEWVLDISLICSDKEESPDDSTVMVYFSCFSHSSWGNEMVHRLTKNMQGEVCRSNRRWRRRIDRHALLSENGQSDPL